MLQPNNYITILGSTGDLGSVLSSYLIEKRYPIHIIVRKGTLEKLKNRVTLIKTVSIKEVETLFDQKLLEDTLTASPIIFDLAGLVSLSFSPKVFPSVLSINGFFPGILAFLNKNTKRRIIYASTQRLQATAKRKDLKLWVTQAVNEFNILIPHIISQDNLEKIILPYSENFLIKHPIPKGLNIYDVSKALGEEFLKTNQESFILRVSSCYGPNCSLRRTVGRLIFTRFLGNSRVEKQEKRDYIFNSDLSNIFEKCLTLPLKNHYEINYVCSGKSVSKEYIYSKIVKYTRDKKGGLKIATNSEKEIYCPSNIWVWRIMKKEQISVEKGIAQTVEYVRDLYFRDSNSATIKRLEALYDAIRQQTDEHGIDPQKIKNVRDTFFTLDGDHWLAHETFWKPTGIVFGFPFPPELEDRFSQMTSKILKVLQLKNKQYWLPSADQLHATAVSYSHYSEKGKNLVSFPFDELSKAKAIVAAYKPITIIFKGVVLTTDGSLLAKGFVENEDLFSLRSRLTQEITGITQKSQPFAHVKLAQVLDDVPYEDTERINRLFECASIATVKFRYLRAANGEVLPFSS